MTAAYQPNVLRQDSPCWRRGPHEKLIAVGNGSGTLTALPVLLFMVPVGPDFEPADEQCRQNVFGLVIGPYAHTSPAGRNVGVVMRRNIIFTTVSRVHHKRLKWLSRQSITDVLRHAQNLPKACYDAIPSDVKPSGFARFNLEFPTKLIGSHPQWT
jgi:hypothetical protein